jgi:hypothetical protein
MSTNSTGVNDTEAQHLLGEIIANGVTVHLCSSAPAYSDGATGVSNVSEASKNVGSADLSTNSASGFADVATITNDTDIQFDVSATTTSTTITHVVLQDQTNTGRFVLTDETNDPDIGSIDTYTISAGTVLYELGDPA